MSHSLSHALFHHIQLQLIPAVFKQKFIPHSVSFPSLSYLLPLLKYIPNLPLSLSLVPSLPSHSFLHISLPLSQLQLPQHIIWIINYLLDSLVNPCCINHPLPKTPLAQILPLLTVRRFTTSVRLFVIGSCCLVLGFTAVLPLLRRYFDSGYASSSRIEPILPLRSKTGRLASTCESTFPEVTSHQWIYSSEKIFQGLPRTSMTSFSTPVGLLEDPATQSSYPSFAQFLQDLGLVSSWTPKW